MSPSADDDTPRPGEETDFKQLPMLGYYEERRSYPRIDLRVPVMISTEKGEVLRGRTRTVSAEGLQVRCSRKAAKAIHPHGTRIPPGGGPKIVLRLKLPAGEDNKQVTAIGRVTYITPRSSDKIAMGVHFVKLQPPDKAVLAGFIMAAMRV